MSENFILGDEQKCQKMGQKSVKIYENVLENAVFKMPSYFKKLIIE